MTSAIAQGSPRFKARLAGVFYLVTMAGAATSQP
jgi:hypothetical protein